MKSERINETGNRYGRLTVLSCKGFDKRGKTLWLCRCDCGNEKIVNGWSLRSGETKSCGCLQRETRLAKGGDKNPNWGGGKTVRRGYMLVMHKNHPRADSRGYAPEHILVMESMLGHPLPEGAVVHHCNGDKIDNRPYNLRLFKTGGEHTAYHEQLKREIGVPI